MTHTLDSFHSGPFLRPLGSPSPLCQLSIKTPMIDSIISCGTDVRSVGVLTLGYSNIVKLLIEISVLKHAKYTKTVTNKCETVI